MEWERALSYLGNCRCLPRCSDAWCGASKRFAGEISTLLMCSRLKESVRQSRKSLGYIAYISSQITRKGPTLRGFQRPRLAVNSIRLFWSLQMTGGVWCHYSLLPQHLKRISWIRTNNTRSGTLDKDFRASSIFWQGSWMRDLSGGPYGQVLSASTEGLRDDSTDSLPARFK